MQQAADTTNFAYIYLGGMLLMAIISPVVGIIMQVLTVEGLRKLVAWWKTPKPIKQDVTEQTSKPNEAIA